VSDLTGLVSTSRMRERSLEGRVEGGGKEMRPSLHVSCPSRLALARTRACSVFGDLFLENVHAQEVEQEP